MKMKIKQTHKINKRKYTKSRSLKRKTTCSKDVSKGINKSKETTDNTAEPEQ